MTYSAEVNAIRQRFHDEWQTAQGFSDDEMGIPEYIAGTTRVAWPNVDFDPPDGLSWVRFGILHGASFQAGMGAARRYRHDGIATVQVFVPAGAGDADAMELADQVCAIFRGQTFDGVRCDAPYVTELGVDNGWYGLVVWCPFFRDSFF